MPRGRKASTQALNVEEKQLAARIRDKFPPGCSEDVIATGIQILGVQASGNRWVCLCPGCGFTAVAHASKEGRFDLRNAKRHFKDRHQAEVYLSEPCRSARLLYTGVFGVWRIRRHTCVL